MQQNANSCEQSRDGRRCVIHIGMNKAGSSTIQSWLKANRVDLGQQGIKFNTLRSKQFPGMSHTLGFAALAAHLGGRQVPHAAARRALQIENRDAQARLITRLRKKVDRLIAEDDYHTYVISSEFLPAWLPDGDSVLSFHDWLSSRFQDLSYVVYLRDQVRWMTSGYSQSVRKGSTLSLPEYLADRRPLNYLRVSRRWSETTGQRLDVRLLERDFLENGDLVSDFATILGADTSDLKAPVPRNEALGMPSIWMLRRVNALARQSPLEAQFRRLRNVYTKSRIASLGRKPQLSDAQSLELAREFARMNEKIRSQYFPERKFLFSHSHALLRRADPVSRPPPSR